MLKRMMVVTAVASLTLLAGSVRADAQQYPPAASFCTISDTTPTPGQSVTITCGGYAAGAEVTFTFFSAPVVLGTAVADADGQVSLTAEIPSYASLGAHTITASGAAAVGGTLTQTIHLTVVGAGSADAGTRVPGTVSGTLPTTGSNNSMPLARAGALLLAVGGVAVLVTRRRRAEARVTVG